MPNIAFVNGKFMALTRARVSVEDRGFQFGDGVYELLRVYRNRIYHLDEHLKRLEQSARAIGLSMVYSPARWRSILTTLQSRSRHPDAKLYIQITRGEAPRDHAFPKVRRFTVVATARKISPPAPALRAKGASVITVPDVRWGRCDIKSINLLPNLLARQKAREAGAFEALFLREGRVLEGAGSNLFCVRRGEIQTPPKGPGILSGITREVVIQLAREGGRALIEKDLTPEDLAGADEVFLTGTTVEVLPVTRVDGRTIGDGRPGPISLDLYRRFLESIRNDAAAP